MSRNTSNRVVLITGASSGIGQACAERLASRGYRVFGASRSCPTSIHERGLSTIAMDVCDAASVQTAVAQVIDAAGQIDTCVNNAGIVLAGAVEDLSPEDLTRQFDTNVYGMLRVCQAALPHMRRQRAGLIINISSLAARIGIPFQGAYSASKWALEALSESLSIEVRPFGVRVVLIQPGDHKTPAPENRQWSPAAKSNPLYAKRARHAIEVMAEGERNGRDPDCVARVVERVMDARNPRLRYVVAKPLDHVLAALHRGLFSGRAFERIMIKLFDSVDESDASGNDSSK
jgi:NAD(P)-dependent dehydrogenase (short-subunit alcohol dehydrogenase family)